MKKTIIILTGAIVAISLLWLVDETLLTKTSAPSTPEKQQEAVVVGQQDSTTEQKTRGKPISKPPVYDLSRKAHWYDPETTIGLYESKTLSEWLEPFHPKPEEFQIIAQYETEYKKLNESLSEDEYYSVEGRKRLIDEILKLNEKLREQLGDERTQFYAEVRKIGTGYYDTWKVLTANGVSEERVSEFRELADEFNQKMHGMYLFRGRFADNSMSEAEFQDFRANFRDKRRIAKSFRDRIEKEFGRQVLHDIILLGSGYAVSMLGLDRGYPMAALLRRQYPEHKERLKKLYDFEFGVGTGAFEKHIEETDRREKREMKLAKEWAKHYNTPLLVPEEILIISP